MPLVQAARAYFARRPPVVRLVEVLAPLGVFAAYIPEVRLVFGTEALIGWGIGAIGFAVAALAEVFQRRGVPRGTGSAQDEGQHAAPSPLKLAIVRSLLLLVFMASVTFLVNADIAGADYPRGGSFIITYSACRLILAFALLIALTVFAGQVHGYAEDIAAQLFAPEPYVSTVLETPGKLSGPTKEDH